MARKAIMAAGFIDLKGDDVDYHQGQHLLIENGRIVGFGDNSDLPDDISIIDHSSWYCLPGFIDTAFLPGLTVSEDGSRPDSYGESVWQAMQAATKWKASGITSVASMGAAERMDLDLARTIQEKRITGPRLYPALNPLVPAGANKFHQLYGVREVSGADDARRAVRELVKHGAQRIVIYADIPLEFHADPYETSRHRLVFSRDELTEIVTQARQAGCFVHAQAISTQAIDHCIDAGVRSIGCAFGLRENHLPKLVENNIALAPNLALGAVMREKGPGAGFSPAVIEMVATQRIKPELLMQAAQLGVEIICGTNTAFLVGDVVRECSELHQAGLSKSAILRAATQNGAATLKPYIESGFFHPRHYADFLFVEGNPVEDLSALAHVREVMVEGNTH